VRYLLGPVCEQSICNVVDRWAVLEVLPAARHHGLGLIP
jgi:NDP-hexose C3-ketoreductase / dTDP-4-oxo-2-deoxy-alpha-D-pentos-2-ene 2,3-reductase